MIINTEQNSIEVLGDIKEFKTSIDPKNIEFITTLLSSNLYSNPEQSFIREIVSNAWDSNVEAGTTDIPIIIKFTKNEELWNISIRDFGTGLSPERFQNIFCNIGSSTKRDSNAFTGGFGIGRFSALACSNTVYITSYYNGTAFLYIMVKSGNTITTNLVSEKPTDEKNGVEVSILNIYDIVPYKRALKYIIFFPNVYIDGISNDINDTKIKKFNNFAAASLYIENKILLGNVLYPCNDTLLTKDSKQFLDYIEYSGIVVKFDIGELNITPNRENIIYTKNTIDRINERINKAREELESLVSKKCVKDYDNLYDLYYITRNLIAYNPIEDSIVSVGSRFSSNNSYYTKVDINSITFKGNKIYDNDINIIKNFFTLNIPNIKGLFYNDKFYQNKMPYCLTNRCNMRNKQILSLVSNTTRLTSVVKEWLKENYGEYTIITHFSEEEFKHYILRNIAIFNTVQFATRRDTLLNWMYEYIVSNITTIDIDTNTSLLSYKANNKKKSSNVRIKDIIIYEQVASDYRNKKTFINIEQCIKYLKNLHKGVILSYIQENSNSWYDIANIRGYIFIKARKDIVEAINSLKLSFIIDKEYLLTKDPITIKLYTIIKCLNNRMMPTMYSASVLLETIPIELKKEFIKLIKFYYKYVNNASYNRMARTLCHTTDSYTEYICNKFLKYYDIYSKTCLNVELNPTENNPFNKLLITAVMLKTKAYKISYTAYKNVINNKFLRLLCKK